MRKKYCKFYKRHKNGRGTCSYLNDFIEDGAFNLPCREPEHCMSFELNVKENRKDKLKRINYTIRDEVL